MTSNHKHITYHISKEGMKEIMVEIAGMDCRGCSKTIERVLNSMDGVVARVNFSKSDVELEYNPKKIHFGEITKKIQGLGYEVKSEKFTLDIEGLNCGECAHKMEFLLNDLEGVFGAEVFYTTSRVNIFYNPKKAELREIKRIIQNLGFDIRSEEKEKRIPQKKIKTIATSLSGVLFISGWISSYLESLEPVGTSMFLLSLPIGGYFIAKSAYYSLRSKTLDINLLVTMAAVGAVLIGEYFEAAAVVFLVSFGNLLETYTMNKTRNAIKALISLKPNIARVLRDGEEIEVQAEEVKRGEIVLVKSGEKIPVDGEVLKGYASVNQALMTGESIPVEKTVRDEVFSGTVNEAGMLEVRTTKVGEDTTLSRIIEMVEVAQKEKALAQRFVDKFQSYYTPSIIVLSILTFLLTLDPIKSLTLLVVGCPCALVISTPVSIVSGIGNAARRGVLIKGGTHLETSSKLRAVAFDKTSTLTKGKPEVTDIIGDVLKKAAIAEKYSEHPLSRAILKKARESNLEIGDVENFEVIPGFGVVVEYGGERIAVGNERLMKRLKINTKEFDERKENLERKGKISVLVAENDEVMGLIAIADKVREGAKEAISKIRRLGIDKIIMLTGDNERVAKAVAKELRIDEYYAELLPEDKVEKIKDLRKRYEIAMVGDGINDAPSLASADIGIAMGAGGTDLAIESADVTLITDDILKVPYAIGLSRKTLSIIKQNVGFSMLVVIVLLVLAILGKIQLSGGVFGHEASAILVILNGMRLMRYK